MTIRLTEMVVLAGKLLDYSNGKAVDGNTSMKGIPWMCFTRTGGIGWRSIPHGSLHENPVGKDPLRYPWNQDTNY